MTKCSKCGTDHFRKNQRYCVKCHAQNMREWRKTHKPTEEQKVKDRARSMANIYQRRGKLIPLPCKVCGADAEKHHPDYSQPLKVEWLCRLHHLELHNTETA